MNWKQYEKEIFEIFSEAYPEAEIKFDQKIVGRYSKVERQIDVLVEGRVAGRKIRIIIDGKLYSEKIDVKGVENFIPMIADVKADQGILITSKGYTSAAINTAYYGPTEVELDILSFEELKQFQGFGGFPYNGKHGAMMPAPFGWIIDVTKRDFTIATLYQRGKTFAEAQEGGEWMYVNLVGYNDDVPDLDALIKLQEEDTLAHHPKATFDYSLSFKRSDGKEIRIRKIEREELPFQEYTGFIDFENFVFFIVLFTPIELSDKNIRKLEYLLERTLPIDVNLDSVSATKIATLKHLIEKTDENEEKANLYIAMAQIHIDMDKPKEAIICLNKSIDIEPANLGAKLGLLNLQFETDEMPQLMNDLFNLDPGNPEIGSSLIGVAISNDGGKELINFFEEKIKEHAENDEVIASIYFSLGELFYNLEDDDKALENFNKSESIFTAKWPNHQALEAISKIKDELSK